MAETIEVKSEIIRWAIHRSGRTTAGLVQKFPQIHVWESDLARLTLTELEKLAAATLTPLGFFFLPKPPVEELPIPDFRTVKDMPLEGMSPDLIETVNTMVMRQDWYREYLRDEDAPELDFIGSVTLKTNIKKSRVQSRRSSVLSIVGLLENGLGVMRCPIFVIVLKPSTL